MTEERKMMTEQEWVYHCYKNKEEHIPAVIGTRGTWTVGKTPVIILVATNIWDLYVLADLYKVAHHPIRKGKYGKDFLYYAINIVDKQKVREIIKEFKE